MNATTLLSLDAATLLALAGAMAVLAALPGLSVITVTTRAATGGMAHGVAAAAGIVVGDAILIGVAVLGLQALQTVPAPLWLALRVAGAAYLGWLGWRLLRPATPLRRSATAATTSTGSGPVRSSFIAGLLLTLADQKALLFYLAFLPAFLDPVQLTALDVALVLAVAILAVGGVKLAYAAIAARASQVLASGRQRGAQRLAGVVVIGVAVWLLLKS